MFFYEDFNYGTHDSYYVFPMTNGSYPSHFHRSYEMLSVLEGRVQILLDNQEYHLSVGDTILFFPNQLHSFTTINASQMTAIIFSPDIIGDFTHQYAGFLPENPILHNIPVPLEKADTDNIYERKSLLYHVCGCYIENTRMQKCHSAQELALLHRILTYIGEHYTDKCSLKDVAKHINYDYTYLSKYFEDNIGITYSSYLNQLRIHHACRLLQEESKPVSEIAFLCGYDTIRTFHRNFSKYTGKTPGEYLKSIKSV